MCVSNPYCNDMDCLKLLRTVHALFNSLKDCGWFDVEGLGEAEECEERRELPPGFQLGEERAVNIGSEGDFLLGKSPVSTQLT